MKQGQLIKSLLLLLIFVRSLGSLSAFIQHSSRATTRKTDSQRVHKLAKMPFLGFGGGGKTYHCRVLLLDDSDLTHDISVSFCIKELLHFDS